MGEAGEEVQLYVYDLTGGMAKSLGQSLLRKNINNTYYTPYGIFTIHNINGLQKKILKVFGTPQ